MKKQQILVVDDEQDLCEILSFNLTSAGYMVDIAYSGEQVLSNGHVGEYDLILLDVMMPGMSGFEVAKRLRQQPETSSVPIIFLTALGSEDDTLHGFDLGADDYISKPFSVREVIARIKAVLGRTADHHATTGSTFSYKGLKVNLNKMLVEIDGQAVALTRTEFDMLILLLENRGKVFTRQEILEKVWPSDVIVTDRTIDVNITRLRKKIGPYSSCIITRHGYGYTFIGA